MWWNHLIHLGDLPLTTGAAVATSIWLATARAWRLTLWWTLLYVCGIGVVALSKVAYLIWGASPAMPDFRALSGHATGFTAVVTTILYFLRQPYSRNAQLAIAVGLGLGAAMVAMLVAHGDHTFSEAAAGWCMGGMMSISVIRLAGEQPTPQVRWGFIWCSAAFLLTVLMVRNLPFGYLMVKAARVVAQHAGGLPQSFH